MGAALCALSACGERVIIADVETYHRDHGAPRNAVRAVLWGYLVRTETGAQLCDTQACTYSVPADISGVTAPCQEKVLGRVVQVSGELKGGILIDTVDFVALPEDEYLCHH